MGNIPPTWNPRTPLTGPFDPSKPVDPKQLASKWFLDAWNPVRQAIAELLPLLPELAAIGDLQSSAQGEMAAALAALAIAGQNGDPAAALAAQQALLIATLAMSNAIQIPGPCVDMEARELLAGLSVVRPGSDVAQIVDTFGNRGNYPATSFAVGSTYQAADYGLTFVVEQAAGANFWAYASGVGRSNQAALAALGLAATDVGVLWEVEDYAHVLRWTGVAWQFGPGDSGSGMIIGFPFTPTGGVWQACDGSATTYLNGDGTVGNFTTPNLTGQYLKFNNGGYTGTIAKSGTTTAPVFAGAPLAAHAHETPLQLVSNVLQRLLDGSIFGTGSNRAAIGQVVTTPDTTSAAVALTQAVSAGTPAGTVSAPGPGTIELDRTELLPYFRR